MKYSNLLKVAFRALVRNKLRAILTMLGIIIGVGSVIAMLAIGQGSKMKIRNEMSAMGTNMIIIWPNYQMRGGVNLGYSASEALKLSDVDALRNEASDLAAVSPEVRQGVQVIYGGQNDQTTIYGVSEEYLTIKKLEVQHGRMFTQSEVRSMEKVCLLGQTVIRNLFGEDSDPVGLEIRIGDLPFLVIGTLKPKGDNAMGMDQDDIILAPYTTVMHRVESIDYVNTIFASAVSEAKSPEAMTQVTDILRRLHKIKRGADDDFRVRSQSELIQTVSSISDVMTYLLGSIAGISLLVGGIGIMNIMFVSVTERTREIGIRMSIGGRGRDIMRQFLVESMVLSLLGGAAGILFGIMVAKLAGSLLGSPIIVTSQSVVLSFVVCFAIGVFFGWYPARKASNLNPIDALRYE
ncbi:MAG: ABC transporter permease [Bacteroidales bacterium]